MTTDFNTSNAASGEFAAGPPTTSLASGVLDLEELRNRCMGDVDLVQQVLKNFEQRIPEEMETIEKALQLQDTEQIACIAHRVKGTLATVSAEGSDACRGGNRKAGRQGRLSDLPAGIEHLHDEWEKYLNCAAALLSAAGTM